MDEYLSRHEGFIHVLLILAVFLCVKSYRSALFRLQEHCRFSSGPTFLRRSAGIYQRQVILRKILEKMAFSIVRVLGDEDFQDDHSESQQEEHKSLPPNFLWMC